MTNSRFCELFEASFPPNGAGDLFEEAETDGVDSLGRFSENIGADGDGGSGEGGIGDRIGEALARGVHERGVVGAGDFEGDGAFHSGCFGGGLGIGKFCGRAGENNLAAPIEVRDFPSGLFCDA